MRRALIPLLLIWAVVATVLAIRWETPLPTTTDGARDDAAEVESLRRRVAELERREKSGATEMTPSPAGREVEIPLASRSHGAAADRLLASYRMARDGRDSSGRREALRRLSELAERQRSVHLVWAELIREARNSDEIDEISAHDGDSRPDPGGPIDREVRAGLRDLMLRGVDGDRRAAAAELLFWIVVPQPEDFHAALGAVRTEGDDDARIRILGEMGDLSLRSTADAADAAAYLRLLRDAVEGDHGYLASTLAEWSDDRADFDRLRDRFSKTLDSNLLDAFRGGRRLTKGREAECVEILAAIVADPRQFRKARYRAANQLDSLRPWWSTATEETLRLYLEERKRQR